MSARNIFAIALIAIGTACLGADALALGVRARRAIRDGKEMEATPGFGLVAAGLMVIALGASFIDA